MDELDRKILRHMQRNPDASIAAIAETVGMSHTPCWRRIRKMESDGIIEGRALRLNGQKLGIGVDVFAHIRLKMHDEATLEALENEARSHPQIVECFSMSGESDYLMRIVVGSIDDYQLFLKKTLLHFPGVSSVNSSFALQRVKLTCDLPI